MSGPPRSGAGDPYRLERFVAARLLVVDRRDGVDVVEVEGGEKIEGGLKAI